MTFAVIDMGGGSEKVVGTIWASQESEAQTIAADLLQVPEKDKVVIRRAEEREIPMKPFN
jgi:hypothetical protein